MALAAGGGSRGMAQLVVHGTICNMAQHGKHAACKTTATRERARGASRTLYGGRLRLARHARFTEVMVADPDFEIESLRKSAAIVAKHELLMPHELSEVCRHASKPPEPSANTAVAGAGQVPAQMCRG